MQALFNTRWIAIGLCSLVCAAPALASTTPDLSSSKGFASTCASLPKSVGQLRSNAERQAFAICRDVALVQQVTTFMQTEEKKWRAHSDLPKKNSLNKLIRLQLSHMRNELRASRLALEAVTLKEEKGLLLAPAQWQVDLNSDGELTTWERYFFAIPKPTIAPFGFRMPSHDPDYYAKDYQLNAQIRVDQSDVLWALSYHCFAESLVEIVLSYQLNDTRFHEKTIELRDPAGMKRAGQLLTKGLKISEQLRTSVLAETDSDQEWIANPKQKNSVFPQPLDDEDFQVWQSVLQHLIPLFEGKTVLAGDRKAGGFIAATAKLCPAGQGLSVPQFFNHPPRYPISQFQQNRYQDLCVPVNRQHKASGLLAFLEHYNLETARRGGDPMIYMRHFFWVN